jgi:hypothetical protein
MVIQSLTCSTYKIYYYLYLGIIVIHAGTLRVGCNWNFPSYTWVAKLDFRSYKWIATEIFLVISGLQLNFF